MAGVLNNTFKAMSQGHWKAFPGGVAKAYVFPVVRQSLHEAQTLLLVNNSASSRECTQHLFAWKVTIPFNLDNQFTPSK